MMDPKGSNSNILIEGDTVQVIKDLKVKGSSLTPKRDKTFKSLPSPYGLGRNELDHKAL